MGIEFNTKAPTPGYSWTPEDMGLMAMTYLPESTYTGGAPTSGRIEMSRIRVETAGQTTGVSYCISTIGSGLTASQSYLALFDTSGTRLAITADLSGTFAGTIGTKTEAWAAAATITPGDYFIAVMCNGTTPVQFRRCDNYITQNGTKTTPIAGLRIIRTSSTSNTSIPASVDFSSGFIVGGVNPWLAIYQMPATATNRPVYLTTNPGGGDSTNAIQGALDNGSHVVLGPGVFTCAGLAIRDGSSITGAGDGLTTIRLANGSSSDLIITENWATYNGGTTRGGPANFVIRDIELDGNKAGGATGWPLKVFGSAYRVSNVTIRNGAAGGCWSQWGPGGSEMEAQWVNFRIQECDGTALEWGGPHDSIFVNGTIAKNTGTYQLRTGGNGTSEQFTNVHVWGNPDYGVWLDSTAYFVNCQSEGADIANVVFNAAGCQWVGGAVFGKLTGAEVGFQIGDGVGPSIGGTRVSAVRMYNFGASGRPLRWESASAGADIDVTLYADALTAAVSGSPSSSDNVTVLVHDSTTKSGDASVYNSRGRFIHYGRSGSTSSFVLKNNGGTDLVNFNPTSGRVDFVSGTDLAFYTGAYTGKTVGVDASGFVEMAEVTAPAAPAANTARLFVQDNGSGKTQLAVRFPTGAVQTIVTEPQLPAIVDTAVTASTTATKLCDGSPRRRNLTLTNNGAVTVYLGSSDVSTTAFFRPLAAGATDEFTRGPGGDDPLPEAAWYGIVASGTASVSVGEVLA